VECPPLWSRSSSRKHASQLSQRCITNVGHGNMTITLLRPIEPCRVGAPARSPPPPAPARPTPPPTPLRPGLLPLPPTHNPRTRLSDWATRRPVRARYLVVAGAGVCLHRVGVGGGGGGGLVAQRFPTANQEHGHLSLPPPPQDEAVVSHAGPARPGLPHGKECRTGSTSPPLLNTAHLVCCTQREKRELIGPDTSSPPPPH
jgi:hypothetical protein